MKLWQIKDDLPACVHRMTPPHVLCRRRLVRKIYIPLPEATARHVLISAMLKDQTVQLKGGDVEEVVRATEGYSGSDLRALCQEAAMVPIR